MEICCKSAHVSIVNGALRFAQHRKFLDHALFKAHSQPSRKSCFCVNDTQQNSYPYTNHTATFDAKILFKKCALHVVDHRTYGIGVDGDDLALRVRDELRQPGR